MRNESRRSASVAACRRWAVEGSASAVRKPVAALGESIHAAGFEMSGMRHSGIPPNPGMARMEFLLGIPSRSGRPFFVSLRRREAVFTPPHPVPLPPEGGEGTAPRMPVILSADQESEDRDAGRDGGDSFPRFGEWRGVVVLPLTPPLLPEWGGEGRGEEGERSTSARMVSTTPSRLLITSLFQKRITRQPRASNTRVRALSRATAIACWPPSTSITSLREGTAKSAMWRPMGCWRRTLTGSGIARRARQRTRSAWVAFLRRVRARRVCGLATRPPYPQPLGVGRFLRLR